MLFSVDVFFAFILSIVFTTSGQLLQKKASLKYSQTHSIGVFHHFFSVEVALSVILLGLGLLCWLVVLTNVELSVAYPLLSINYIAILLGARLLFNEAIPIRRWIGVVIILLGISILVRS